jgi:hypothetical protein
MISFRRPSLTPCVFTKPITSIAIPFMDATISTVSGEHADASPTLQLMLSALRIVWQREGLKPATAFALICAKTYWPQCSNCHGCTSCKGGDLRLDLEAKSDFHSVETIGIFFSADAAKAAAFTAMAEELQDAKELYCFSSVGHTTEIDRALDSCVKQSMRVSREYLCSSKSHRDCPYSLDFYLQSLEELAEFEGDYDGDDGHMPMGLKQISVTWTKAPMHSLTKAAVQRLSVPELRASTELSQHTGARAHVSHQFSRSRRALENESAKAKTRPPLGAPRWRL